MQLRQLTRFVLGVAFRIAASLDGFFGRRGRCTRLLRLLAWSQTLLLVKFRLKYAVQHPVAVPWSWLTRKRLTLAGWKRGRRKQELALFCDDKLALTN